jgi:Na+-driven multidrug efflux pump
VIQSGVNSFGSAASAGSAAALNFEIIAYYIVNAFNQAVVTFTSQNYAAGKFDRCRRVFRLGMLFTVIGAGAMDFLFVAAHGVTLSLFTTDPQVAQYAVIRLTHILAFQWMVSFYEISGSAMRGMGYSMTPTMITIVGTCVFRIFWTFVLFPRHRSFGFLLYVYPVSWLITGSLVLAAYFLVSRKAMPVSALKKG